MLTQRPAHGSTHQRADVGLPERATPRPHTEPLSLGAAASLFRRKASGASGVAIPPSIPPTREAFIFSKVVLSSPRPPAVGVPNAPFPIPAPNAPTRCPAEWEKRPSPRSHGASASGRQRELARRPFSALARSFLSAGVMASEPPALLRARAELPNGAPPRSHFTAGAIRRIMGSWHIFSIYLTCSVPGVTASRR